MNKSTGGGFPVILHEADIVIQGIDPQGAEALKIDVLDMKRGGFHDHLILVVMSQAVGVLSLSAVGGAPGGLYIVYRPGFRT